LGHRVSRDLDLFTREPTRDLEVVRTRFVDLGGAEVDSLSEAALHGRIGSVSPEM
jgi:hypothetical protein